MRPEPVADPLDNLLSPPPSENRFVRAMEWIDGLPARERDQAIDRAAAAVQSWPDNTRTAPAAAWQRIQQGEAPPPWWTLVRHVQLVDGDSLDVGPALAPLTSVDAIQVNVDPSPLHEAPGLRALDLTANEEVVSLDFLAGLPRLERLVVSGVELLQDLSPLRELTALHTLSLTFNPDLDDLTPLASMESLRRLDLTGNEYLKDFAPLATLTNLEALVLDDCVGLRSLAFLEGFERLQRLSARRLPLLEDLRPLAGSRLKELFVGGAKLSDGTPLGDLTSLVELGLFEAPRLRDLSFLPRLPKLRILYLDALSAALPTLNGPELERLFIGNCSKVRGLKALEGLPALKELTLEALPVKDLTPLAGLHTLELLALNRCHQVRDLAPLSRHPLRQLSLIDPAPGLDTSVLPADCRVVR